MNKGFTLIETMIALVLVTMAMLFMAAALSHSHSQYRLSFKRFAVIQRLENLKNQLLSLPFDSAESAIGVHSVREERIRIVWVVSASSPALKRIEGTVFDPLTKRTLVFFKSKFLLEVNDD
jgi:prepilin-type N-terminal cleavage/methylation domain-containing protein